MVNVTKKVRVNMEQEPSFTVEINDKKYELSQSNTTLYRHLGAKALDHFFLKIGETETTITGTRFFREIFAEDSFDTTSNYMLQKGYEAHLNIHEPAEDDMEAYIRFSNRSEETPDWLPES